MSPGADRQSPVGPLPTGGDHGRPLRPRDDLPRWRGEGRRGRAALAGPSPGEGTGQLCGVDRRPEARGGGVRRIDPGEPLDGQGDDRPPLVGRGDPELVGRDPDRSDAREFLGRVPSRRPPGADSGREGDRLAVDGWGRQSDPGESGSEEFPVPRDRVVAHRNPLDRPSRREVEGQLARPAPREGPPQLGGQRRAGPRVADDPLDLGHAEGPVRREGELRNRPHPIGLEEERGLLGDPLGRDRQATALEGPTGRQGPRPVEPDGHVPPEPFAVDRPRRRERPRPVDPHPRQAPKEDRCRPAEPRAEADRHLDPACHPLQIRRLDVGAAGLGRLETGAETDAEWARGPVHFDRPIGSPRRRRGSDIDRGRARNPRPIAARPSPFVAIAEPDLHGPGLGRTSPEPAPRGQVNMTGRYGGE